MGTLGNPNTLETELDGFKAWFWSDDAFFLICVPNKPSTIAGTRTRDCFLVDGRQGATASSKGKSASDLPKQRKG